MERSLTTCGVLVAAVFALHSVQAGERKAGAGNSGASLHKAVFGAQSGSAGGNSATISKMQRPGEFSVLPVRVLETRSFSVSSKASTSDNDQSERRSTPRQERKGITFFRLDPKFGDVSVQPVIGGVNGAQISVGF